MKLCQTTNISDLKLECVNIILRSFTHGAQKSSKNSKPLWGLNLATGIVIQPPSNSEGLMNSEAKD